MVVRIGTICPCPEILGSTAVPFGTAIPCQFSRTRPVLIVPIQSGRVQDQSGPRSAPSLDFSLQSRMVRSGLVRS